MPILDITLVGHGEPDPDLARRLADACGRALETPPGRTWVRLHRIAKQDYAESGGAPVTPVFATVLLAHPPDDRRELARRLTAAIAGVMGRPAQHVHVLVEPPAAGRIAFGGELVPAPAPARASSGARWEAIAGYSRAVRVGAHIWVTGTTSVDANGEPVGEGDAYAQTRRALEIIASALAGLGASMQDVVRTRMFVTNIERDFAAIARAHTEPFADVRPATTMVEVSRLIEPWMLVEIEADAFVSR